MLPQRRARQWFRMGPDDQACLGSLGDSLEEMADTARAAEAGGFDSVRTAELRRTATTPLAAIAAGTSGITVANAIAVSSVRCPMTILEQFCGWGAKIDTARRPDAGNEETSC